MNDIEIQPNGTAAVTDEDAAGSVKLVYILYLVGLIVPFVGIVGVVLAYVKKGEAPEWAQTHYRFQIRTFWIYMLYMLIGMVLALVLIGYLVLLFAIVWYIVRCVKPLASFVPGQAHPNPGTWMFG